MSLAPGLIEVTIGSSGGELVVGIDIVLYDEQFIDDIIIGVITYPCWDSSYSMLLKRAPGVHGSWWQLCWVRLHHQPLQHATTKEYLRTSCQKQVSQAGINNCIPQYSGIRWDAITYPCLRYLILVTKSSFIVQYLRISCWLFWTDMLWGERKFT